MAKMLKVLHDFSGGLSEVANDNMKNNELVMAKNVVPGDGHGISRCKGTDIAYAQVKVNTTVTRVIELQARLGTDPNYTYETQTLAFVTADGTEEEIYKWDSTAEAWYPITEDSATVVTTADGGETIDSTTVDVVDGSIFSVGDIIHDTDTEEKMLITAISTNALTVTRGYYGTTAAVIANADDIVLTEAYVLTPIKSWFIFAYKLYWLDGTAMKVYDGVTIDNATFTYTGSPTQELQDAFAARINASISVVARGSVWFFAHGADEVLFSVIGYPLEFDTDNIINVATPDYDTLTALHTFNEGVLIFKKRSVHYLSGWDFATIGGLKLTQLNVTSGTKWPATIKTIENAVLYLGTNGVYKLYVPYLSSLIASKNISDKKISNTLFSKGALTGARAETWDNIYYLSVDSTVDSATLNREYRFYMSDKAFYGEFTQGAYSYMPGLNSTDRLYIGSDNGYILYYNPDSYHFINTDTGDNAVIPMEARTKGFDVIGATFRDAKVKKIFIAAKQYETESSDLTIQIKADYADAAYATEISSVEDILGSSATSWVAGFDESLIYDEGEWSAQRWGWLDTVTKEIPIGQKCKRLQFIFSGDAAQPLLIYGLGIVYKKKKVKGNTSGVTSSPLILED